MSVYKNKLEKLKKIPTGTIGFVFLLLVASLLLWSGDALSNQSEEPQFPIVYFQGEYSINSGEWQEIRKDVHIPSTKGDVRLRGAFHMLAPSGEYIGPVGSDVPVAFYLNHIRVAIYEGDNPPIFLDNENELFGEAACGESWIGHYFQGDGTQNIEILIQNPHSFGNEMAVDELIENFSPWINMDFEREVIAQGAMQRNIGLIFIIASLVLLGIALFSTLIHLKRNRLIWMMGLAILFAGGYFVFSADGNFFWNESVVFNTTILNISMMFYMLLFSRVVTYSLVKTKKAAIVTVLLLGAADCVFLLLPMISDVFFYDTLPFWVIIQSVVNAVLVVCIIIECIKGDKTRFSVYIGSTLALVAFEIDVIATALGIWSGGMISKYVFVALFVAALVVVLRIIPNSINAVMKANELEAEKNSLNAQLAQSRISTMISQIRPHFIYNTLGSIEQLCELNPPKAGELVHSFAKYLRGNFGELDNPRPILMSQEIEHVKYYVSIESVRFPDIGFSFEMNSGDFEIPALTIQPIVENAIKHGLMKLQKGGSVKVTSYETQTHYCVEVTDDGVGFDPGVLLDERKHVGLRNIRGRLEAMVSGTLEIESEQGKGTTVLIKIPKELNL